ncbi:hypothetical protein [Streptomyces lunalinharesii]|uniref:Secreted protein n=1 Tax=Streptomyces lunalinharesii TaxID=333384 RepID=A0ABN3SW78_9ACTN
MREHIRTWLRWPLYSPQRLAAVLIALVVVLCVISALNTGSSPSSAPAGDAQPSPAAPDASASPSMASSPSAGPSASPDLDGAVVFARAFVAAWASHTESKQWYATLAPSCTERLATKLATTDPSRIKATKVGGAKVTDTGGGELTSAAVDTDAGQVSVGMVWTGNGWLVRDIEPGAQAVG